MPSYSPPINPYNTEDLIHLADILLLAGELLMVNGAPSQRTHDTLVHIAHRLGCQQVEVLIAYDHISLTLSEGRMGISRLKTLPDLGANFGIIASVTWLSHRLDSKALTLQQVERELQSIATQAHACPKWLMPILSGLGCGTVGQIFGGDSGAFFVDFGATFLGSIIFILGLRPTISPYITTALAASVTGFIVRMAIELNWTLTPASALSASVLFLVPGVPLISGLLDMLLGQINTGLARLINAFFFCLAIALGLLFAYQTVAIWAIDL